MNSLNIVPNIYISETKNLELIYFSNFPYLILKNEMDNQSYGSKNKNGKNINAISNHQYIYWNYVLMCYFIIATKLHIYVGGSR